MKRTVLNILSVILLITPVVASSSDSIPNAYLRVTVQQREDGKIDKSFHVLELSCWNGNCFLSTVTLNRCFESSSGKWAFYPVVQYSSTGIGNLKVRNEGNTIFVQETGQDISGDYVVNLRFDYETRGKDKTVTRLTGFSGGYVKNSVILKEVLTTDYVPLVKANQVMELDCGVLLPGIDKK